MNSAGPAADELPKNLLGWVARMDVRACPQPYASGAKKSSCAHLVVAESPRVSLRIKSRLITGHVVKPLVWLVRPPL